MFLPVQIPTAVKQQCAHGSQSVTGLLTPMHALMFLPTGYNQVITFFDMGAADIVLLGAPFSIVGDVRLAVFR